MTNPTIYYYLLLTILDTIQAPIYYETFLKTNTDEDYTQWLLHHHFSLGLAIALDNNKSFFPNHLEEIIALHEKTDTNRDFLFYCDIMTAIQKLAEKSLIMEIQKNKISQKSEKYFAQIIQTDKKEFIDLFKKYVNQANVLN